MLERVRKLLDRLAVVEADLGKPELLADKKTYREITQEHAYLSQIKEVWQLLTSA